MGGARYGGLHQNIGRKDTETHTGDFYEGRGCPEHGLFAVSILPSYFNRNDLKSSCGECLGTGIGKEPNPLLRPGGYEKQMPGYTPREGGELVDFEGFIPRIQKYFENWQKGEWNQSAEELFHQYMEEVTCRSCHGTGLKKQRNLFRLAGFSYHALGELELKELREFFEKLEVPAGKELAYRPMMRELTRKIDDLIDIGLAYLSMNRRIDTLSGGEYQRVRLAGQLGSGLRGLTYIIDEPTAGLHSADTEKIRAIIRRFIEKGNTVITVEHDLDIIRSADHVLELGEGSGKRGGRVVAKGTVQDVMENERSVLACYLRREQALRPPENSAGPEAWIRIRGARAHNLKNADIDLPLYRLVCLTGVSGSGKSSVAVETLYKAIRQRSGTPVIPGEHDRIEGLQAIRNAYCIDQRPISGARTSTPTSYIQIMDRIRRVFSQSAEAGKEGLTEAAYFSYNTKGGSLPAAAWGIPRRISTTWAIPRCCALPAAGSGTKVKCWK